MDPVAPAPSESTRKGSSQHQFQTSNPEVGLTPSQEELLTRATLASIEDVISHINTRTHRYSPARPQTDASSQTHTTPGKNAESDDDAIFVDASQAGTVQHLRLPHHLRLIYHLSHGDCGASEKSFATLQEELSKRPLKGVFLSGVTSLFNGETNHDLLSRHFNLARKIVTRTKLSEQDQDLLSQCVQRSRWHRLAKGPALDNLTWLAALTATKTFLHGPVEGAKFKFASEKPDPVPLDWWCTKTAKQSSEPDDQLNAAQFTQERGELPAQHGCPV
ncbi:hypothetical protein DB88DRAFT_545479 [Papiliotrema laurentii]|uniref:Uncharacterized protein n=1 Tax=Papiliotrema laurentii TaxID=5418 RepID=A0AAD9L855_PAPLA|nr:hypothetical protein DB88DRAFT_545479 [Papiliotrema laurentii]